MRGIAFTVLALAACSSGSTPVEPGSWETTTRLLAGEAELWSSTTTRCIDAEEAAAPGTDMLNTTPLGPCAPADSAFANGSFSIQARCPGRGPGIMASVPMVPGTMPSRVSVQGSYTGTTMEGRLEAELEDTLEPIRFTGTMSARRTGDCGS